MSRIRTKDRAEILTHQLNGVLSRGEIAKMYGVTENFIADLDAQLEMLISRGLLSPKDGISFADFTKAMQPVVDLAEDLIRAGMSNEQVHKICKLSLNRLKYAKKMILKTSPTPSMRRQTLLFKDGLEGRILTSIFAINYRNFSSESTNLVSVLIALLISQKQARQIYPNEDKELSLKEAFEIAEDIDAEKADFSNADAPYFKRYELDTCPTCGLSFLRHIRGPKRKYRCPFCELKSQIHAAAHQAKQEQLEAELTEKKFAERALDQIKEELGDAK